MKVFIDGGYHLGQGLSYFIGELKIDKDWMVFIFEPNPECGAEKRIENYNYQFKTNLHKCAIFNKNCEIDFLSPSQNGEKHYGFASEESDHQNMASSIFENGLSLCGMKPGDKDKMIKVKTIDFSKFIDTIKGNEIYVKLDIEGAEFPVLQDLIDTGNIKYISKIWVEWHYSKEEHFQLKEKIHSEVSKYCEIFDWH